MTAFPKVKRIVDLALLARVALKPCTACARPAPSDPHHVTTRGAGGDDVSENVMPLCRYHHDEWHRLGPRPMADKYKNIRTWLESASRWDILN